MMEEDTIKIDEENCTVCLRCRKWCPRDAISIDEYPIIDHERCIYCGECMVICPEDVIEVKDPSPNTHIYEEFADVYQSGKYPEFSEAMADLLIGLLDEFDVEGERVLDIACGEGSFAVKMAEKGYDVVGMDISSRQIQFAEGKDSGEKVDFMVKDMRELDFQERFDVVTCWYDSMNYILEEEGLKQVFNGVYDSLRKGGIFVFDVNTIYVMEEVWDEQTMVKEDSNERFDLIEQNYEEEKHISSMKLTSFLPEGEDCWKKIEEVHRERAYSFERLREIFEEVGFEELARWKDLEEKTEADEKTERAWFLLRKK